MTQAKKVDDEFVQIRPVIFKDKVGNRLMAAPDLTPFNIIIIFFNMEKSIQPSSCTLSMKHSEQQGLHCTNDLSLKAIQAKRQIDLSSMTHSIAEMCSGGCNCCYLLCAARHLQFKLNCFSDVMQSANFLKRYT